MTARPWKFALLQHPMYLLIDRDRGEPKIRERVPPWGAEYIEEYLDRIRRNLESLAAHPHLKIDYEFSGAELRDLAERAPDVAESIRGMVARGKLGMVGGDYAQSHHHAFGPESGWRQIAYGLREFEQITGYRVVTWAHQESSLHDQLPQMLRAFGFKFGVVPGHCFTLQVLDGKAPEITGIIGRGLRFTRKDTFTDWKGIDGTTLPTFLQVSNLSTDEHLQNEEMRDLYASPELIIHNPDLEEIPEDWYQKRRGIVEFVRLDEALADEIRQNPPTSRSRVVSYWSYVEGMWTEKVMRAVFDAERRALDAEALFAVARLFDESLEPSDFEAVWKDILLAQHHDVFWQETTDLKEQALAWLSRADETSQATLDRSLASLLARVDTSGVPENPHALINTVPKARKNIEKLSIDVGPGTARSIALLAEDGSEIPVQPMYDASTNDAGFTSAEVAASLALPGLGYRVVGVVSRETEWDVKRYQTREPIVFTNEHYRATIRPDGTFSSLEVAGREMLDPTTYLGNELRGQDASGSWFTNIDSSKTTDVVEGPVGMWVTTRGPLGPGAYELRIQLYHDHPRIDFLLALRFEDAEVGKMWLDESKLNAYWPLAQEELEIWHDIPFGAVEGRAERPLHTTSWIDSSFDGMGLAFLHRGGAKHWARKGGVASVLAWGGWAFNNRLNFRADRSDGYDLRLKGEYMIPYAILPHPGSWQEAGIPDAALAYNRPAITKRVDAHTGDLPPHVSFFQIDDPNLIPTAVVAPEIESLSFGPRVTLPQTGFAVRLFETVGRPTRIHARSDLGLGIRAVQQIDGAAVGSVEPYKIVVASVE